MALTKAEAANKIPQAVHDDLKAEGIDSSAWIDWVLTHSCDVVSAVRALLPLIPMSDKARAALLALLTALCP